MANDEHVRILKRGVKFWNQWRYERPPNVPYARWPNSDTTEWHQEETEDGKTAHWLQQRSFDRLIRSISKVSHASRYGRLSTLLDIRLGHNPLDHPRPVDLSWADLGGADLGGADLSEANLNGANLVEANLREANLRGAHLEGANLAAANLAYVSGNRVRLDGATLVGASLAGASLKMAKLPKAQLVEANLSGAYLAKADLTEANLSEADLSEAYLLGAKLTRATVRHADFFRANLSDADLTAADLRECDLQMANLLETDFERANLSNCRIYGASAWGVKLACAVQTDLVVTPQDESTITVDNLNVAQFIYLLLNNAEIRDVIDAITSKVVFILGRFTPERKAILDALRDTLRGSNYLPIVFDFDKPASRDLTETVRTLAHLARFVIADITDPRSIPQELQAIVPDLAVPVQPIIARPQQPWGMFVDYPAKYHWVLKPHEYTDLSDLLADLQAQVIAPAEAKAKQLAGR